MSTEPTTGEDVVHAVVGVALKFVLDDDTWMDFGFSGRPKRGAIFTRLLSMLAGNRIQRETVLLRELTCLIYGSLSREMGHQYDGLDANRLAGRALELLILRDGMAKAYRFDSEREMLDFFLDGFEDYLAVPSRDESIAFVSRVNDQLDEDIPPRWIGAILKHTAVSPLGMMGLHIRQSLGDPVVGEVPLNNEWMADALDPHQGPENEFLE